LDIEVVIKRTIQFAGLVGSVVVVVSVVAFVSQDVLARFVEIPRWLSNVFAAGIIAALYGPVRDWLTNITDRYLFQKKYDYKQLLRAFTDEVVTVLDLRRLVEMIVERLATTLKLETCALFLLNRERQRYDLAANRGLGDATLNIREDEDIVALLRRTQEPVSRDSHGEMPERVTKRFEELKASLCFPLVLHDDLMGVLCLGKKKSDEEFTKDDIDILLSLTKTLAIAVSNAQLVAEAAQKEKLAVIGTLAAAINHEVCNPLNNVKVQSEGFLINLKRGIFDPLSREDLVQKFAELLQRTMAEVDRSAAITTRLSNFAKPVREPISESVDIRQVINDVTALLGHDFELNMIRIQQEIPASLPPIRADRKQIGEIFFNLMRNAAQAIQQNGMITVRARPNPNSRVLVEIQDTGCGMSPEHLGKLFTPFFTTKDEGRGTGLGLFVVQRLVERNGGTISVSSARGVGTTFTLEFSIHESALVQSADR
jgi:signal transduction histidine kinase